MIDVLEFLFENFLTRPIDIQAHLGEIARELPNVGFNIDEIDGALHWLAKTVKNKNPDPQSLNTSNGQRIFTPSELTKLDQEARGMIYQLELAGLLTPNIREFMIDRAMALNTNHVTKEEMRWVILFVMMNSQARNDVIEWIQKKIETGN